MSTRLLTIALCLLPLAAQAQDGVGFAGENRRLHAELWADQAIVSPGRMAHFEAERNRLERLSDRDQAARELRALERDLGTSHSGLPGYSASLAGPMGGFPSLYAPSDTLFSPTIDPSLVAGLGGWR